MSRLARRVVRVTVLASALALLAGCGAGQITQTSGKQTSIGGINADVGEIAIRNAHVVAPPQEVWESGAAVPISLYLSNFGSAADRLMSVSSSAAQKMVMLPTDAPLPASQPSEGAVPGTVPNQPTTPTSSLKTPKPGVAANPAVSPPTRWQPLAIPTDGMMMLSADGSEADSTPRSPAASRPGYVVLMGITQQLRSGDTVTVTLRFATAGEITLELPVSVPATPRPRAPSEAEHAEHE
ncbi:MAG: hypothetical protein ACRDPW_02580 [Mycobacteriales bacterium]